MGARTKGRGALTTAAIFIQSCMAVIGLAQTSVTPASRAAMMRLRSV